MNLLRIELSWLNKIIAIVFLIVCTFSLVRAQQNVQISPQGRYYLEYLPPGYDSNTELYPVLIFLHGHGERGNTDNLSKVAKNGPPKLINQGHNMCFEVNSTTECFIVLSPQQTTNRHGWLGYEVIPFVQHALNTYRIDPDRVYLTGLSMGGQGTWQAAYSSENTPNYFAALAPAPGRGGYSEACKIANDGVPVWAFHGSSDNAMRLNEGQRPINGMNACGADPAPIFTIYSGVGHGGTWDRAYRTDNSLHTPNLYQWFLSQRRGSPPQIPPSVDAGNNINITLPVNSTTITASASDADGTIDNIVWVQNSGPNSAAFSGANQLELTVSNLIAGVYTFEITVTDNDALTASDQVVITVNPEPANVPPAVTAGSDISITLPTNAATVSATVSDSDGTITSLLWTQTSGPNMASILNPTQISSDITGLAEGTYIFILTATDDDGATGTDNISVVVFPEPVNIPPVANAGSDLSTTLPTNTVSLSGTSSDSDGTVVSTTWSQSSGPSMANIANNNNLVTDVGDLIQGTYVFTLLVTDDDGDTDSDQVTVNVFPPPPNDPPATNAGADVSITLPVNSVNLAGSATDSDGTVVSFSWVQVSGPSVASISPSNATNTTVSNLIEGNYTFSLEATDNDGDSDTDNLVVTVLPIPPNDPPSVDAGVDVNITLPQSSVSLSSTASDNDGTIVSYLWQFVSGPAMPAFSSSNTANTSVTGLIEGIYQFSVTVQDDDGAEGSDLVIVTVFPEINTPPTADAGPNKSITLPTSATNLTGSGLDSDGTIVTYAWAQISGPDAALIGTTNAANTSVSSLVEGIYTFKLTVTDNDGATDSDNVNVTVNPEPVNQPPIANAGPDVLLTLPDDFTTLMGSGSDADGTIVGYVWESISGPGGTFGDLLQQNLLISDLLEGIYEFQLTVEDNLGLTATDNVRVIVNSTNTPPTANAGFDITLTLPNNSTSLNGIATDVDGTIDLTLWEQVDGPSSVTIVNPLNTTANVSGLIEGVYRFNFFVQDDEGSTDSDEVRVTVNPEPPNNPPSANAGPNREIILPLSAITLNGSGSDSDGSIASFNWSQVSGPGMATLSNESTENLNASNLVEGIYVFRLEVTDNRGAAGIDDARVTVLPIPGNNIPMVNAGTDITITLPENTANLAGSATDSDGTISSTNWNQILGPVVASIGDPTSLSTVISDLNEGIYVFRLNATDDDGDSSFDEVRITVNPDPANVPPMVQAGDNQTIRLPENSVTLNTTTNDIDGFINSIAWTQISGPSSAALSSTTDEDITVSDLILGTYVFRITVTDNEGGVDFDQVNVRVLEAAANQPPLVIAGDNIIIFEPESETTLTGMASDSDGSVATTSWTQISGPNMAIIVSPLSPNSALNGLTLGTYVFQLTATDNNGLSGFDQINVRVNPPNPNIPPTADAGADIAIQSPLSTAQLQGAASDSDGTIQSVAWSQISGPSTADLSDSGMLNTEASDLAVGNYLFRLTVTDDGGLTNFDEVLVSVAPEDPNVPPTVETGPDLLITLPINSVELSATANDADGTIEEILWTSESGPASTTILSENMLAASVTDLVLGTYVFRVTVTDDDGSTAFDELTVIVSDNVLPSAFAGSDISLIFPENSVELVGSASDSDGTIESREWFQRSGPSSATISVTNQNSITVSDLQIGIYEFEFLVTDDRGAEASDMVSVQVISPDGNQAPIVDAGEDITITLPVTSATLRGTAEDTDGIINRYFWSQVSGENVSISDPNFRELIISNLSLGSYTFELTATDNGGLFASDQVQVTVVPIQLSSLQIPRLFTPNNDGVNDFWVIPDIESVENCTVEIYDPNGFKVFGRTGYQNDWNGTYEGRDLNEGAYYYILECNEDKRTGAFRIIR
ncbi:MAG: gliding motility-associated C-terminal domain-containing protein [Bacteroidota bacterium]